MYFGYKIYARADRVAYKKVPFELQRFRRERQTERERAGGEGERERERKRKERERRKREKERERRERAREREGGVQLDSNLRHYCMQKNLQRRLQLQFSM